MSFGNVPAGVLVGAVEKLLSKMDEAEVAAFYERELSSMPPDAFGTFVEAVFTAFRERGESSEDAAEEAGITLEGIAQRDSPAITAFVAYARANPGLLKEATTLFIEQRPDLVTALPGVLRSALAERLTKSLSSSEIKG
jgi:hypothetical protein